MIINTLIIKYIKYVIIGIGIDIFNKRYNYNLYTPDDLFNVILVILKTVSVFENIFFSWF